MVNEFSGQASKGEANGYSRMTAILVLRFQKAIGQRKTGACWVQNLVVVRFHKHVL